MIACLYVGGTGRAGTPSVLLSIPLPKTLSHLWHHRLFDASSRTRIGMPLRRLWPSHTSPPI
jgi:hypothetical protein